MWVSDHFKARQPSGIRVTQIEFKKRTDDCKDINVAIGNVSLPMHPKMIERMKNLGTDSPYKEGVVQYSFTAGLDECNDAFLNIIASSGFKTEGLKSQVVDGGSLAMELVLLGCCGKVNGEVRPMMLIDPAYTNYNAMAQRTGIPTVSFSRDLGEDGNFSLPDMGTIRKYVLENKPGCLVVIPYDNPTGQFIDHETMVELAKLCVEFDMWFVSDEAYRELYYVDKKPSSVWGITNLEVPGFEGRRISIETASKVWNGCGLRIGALITDNETFHAKSVAESTANLCAPMLDQYIFGSLAHESHENLQVWYKKQREYYKPMLVTFTEQMKELLPEVIVSSPDASLYSVVDVRKIVKEGFDAMAFVNYCATQGKIDVDGEMMTLLCAPMAGFYNVKEGINPGKTQMRLAYVVGPEKMKLVPKLFTELLKKYEETR